MTCLQLSVLPLVLVLCFSHAVPYTYVKREIQDRSIRHHWTKAGAVDHDAVFPVRIGLTQRNIDHGEELLYAIHLSIEEVANFFAPSVHTVETARKWLESEGIHRHRITLPASKQWMKIYMTAEELGRVTNTTYHYWMHNESGDVTVACDEYSLPFHVAPHVELVVPGAHPIRASSSRNTVFAKDGKPPTVILPREAPRNKRAERVTMQDIQRIYEIDKSELEMNPTNKLGIYGYVDDYRQVTLDNFFTKFAPNIPNGTHPVYVKEDGEFSHGEVKKKYIGEAELDMMVSYPQAYPDPVIFYQVDDRYYALQEYTGKRFGIFNTFLDALDGSYCNYTAFGITGDSPKIDANYPDPHKGGYKGKLQCGVYEPPNVLTFSDLSGEPELPVNCQKRQCMEWMKLGLMGVTLLYASGDSGVGSYGCYRNNVGPWANTVVFPASCPWTTVVGATKISYGEKIKRGNEVAALANPDFQSGGGFSNVAKEYLANNPPNFPSYEIKDSNRPPRFKNGSFKGIYNRAGRAVPDISALGQNFSFYSGNKPVQCFCGTSMSAPLVAGTIQRINHYRLAAGKKSVGFINPVLYKNPRALNDVTLGSNPNCWNVGFSASKGWDPVTGLGTPNFARLKKVFMDLP